MSETLYMRISTHLSPERRKEREIERVGGWGAGGGGGALFYEDCRVRGEDKCTICIDSDICSAKHRSGPEEVYVTGMHAS